MEISSPQCKLRECLLCGCSTAYFCSACKHDLCLSCKETHEQDPKTIDHKILTYHFPKLEICAKHPNSVYKKYCTYCELPICSECTEHEKHTEVLDINIVRQLIRDQHREKIDIISRETLLSRNILLERAKADVKIARKKCLLLQNEMLTKAHTLKDLIDKARTGFMYKLFCDFDFKHRCLKQQKELVTYIVNLQKYVYRYERSSSNPLQFILLTKAFRLSEIHLKLHTSHFSMTESVQKEGVLKSLSETIIEKGYRHVGTEFLLKCLPKVEFHHTFTMNYGLNCNHISCINLDRIWVSCMIGGLFLSNRSGEKLLTLNLGLMPFSSGYHTVNKEGDLIYIGNDFKLSKFTKENKTIPICRTYELFQEWAPECVYSSLDTEDILVGMSISTVFPPPKMTDSYRFEKRIGKIFRFNKNGLLKQTTYPNEENLCFSSTPKFITENNNGDVLVSALNNCSHEDKSGAVVVYDQSGIRRFIYRGHTRRSELRPRGICTDALSHVLVCDLKTHSVQMLDKNGKFLSHLLIRPPGIFTPSSLFYDSKTHHLWVGSSVNNTVCVYRYLIRPENMSDKTQSTAKKLHLLSATNNAVDLNELLQHLLSSPGLSENPTEILFFIMKTLERHHGRNKGDVFDIRPDTARSLQPLRGSKTDETENSQEYWNQSAAKVMQPLSKTKISPEGVECPLQLMPSTKQLKFFTVTDVNQCRHICCMTPDLFWIDNDNNDIILKNKQCNTLHKISDRQEKEVRSGSFTLNNEHELIYISKDLSIKKLSSDLTTTTIIIPKWMPEWKPLCVYWSQSSKSLLVGMCMIRVYRGMITRYNPTGELKQVIRYDNNRLELYQNPCFITENNNGDIVVSDSGSAVVVTDRKGKHRFSYTGHPLRLGLEPRGICTDPLSNILVCDSVSISVHVIDKDGQFLFYLPKPKKENWDICDLSYNVHSQQLWIASQDSKIWVLRYIKTRSDTTGEQRH